MDTTARTHSMPEALLSTPADATFCPECARQPWDTTEGYGTGTRYPGDVNTFAHCEVCGTTDLLDTRSPWEVLDEAQGLLEHAQAEDPSDPIRILGRMDVVDRVLAKAQASPCTCHDCATWKARALRGLGR